MLASKNGNIDTIKTLLNNQANISLKDKYGKTALMYAVINGHKNASNFLLKQGAKVDEIDKSEWTSLLWAVKKIVLQLLSS